MVQKLAGFLRSQRIEWLEFACSRTAAGHSWRRPSLLPCAGLRPLQVSGLGPRVSRSLSLVPGTSGFVDLRWQTYTGEYFTVEYSADLAQGFSYVLSSNILATPPSNSITLPATNARSFYRLKF